MPADHRDDILLITGASGKQAASLLPHLIPQWNHLRLTTRSRASQKRLQSAWPAAEVIVADLSNASDCKRLLIGVTACWLVTPFVRNEVAMTNNVIDAAVAQRKEGGPFKHMVRSSVLHPCVRKMVNHDNKRYVEEYLIESGLDFTILQPSHMMETLDVAGIVKDGRDSMPRWWDPATTFSFTCARDLGEVGAKVLEEREEHFYATYEIVSTSKPLSYDDVAVILTEELGKEFKWESEGVEKGVEMFERAILADDVSDLDRVEFKQGVGRMLMYYNDRGLLGNSKVTEMLLGRKPTEYREWVRSVIKEVKG